MTVGWWTWGLMNLVDPRLCESGASWARVLVAGYRKMRAYQKIHMYLENGC